MQNENQKTGLILVGYYSTPITHAYTFLTTSTIWVIDWTGMVKIVLIV